MKLLQEAILKNDYMRVKQALKNVNDINESLDSDDTQNIYFYAIRQKVDVDILILLIESGLDLDYCDDNGVGILDESVKYNNLELIKYLVEKKNLNPNVTNRKSGFTPFMQAVSYGYLELVKYLLSVGVDTDIKDSFGLSAKDYARKLGQNNILEYLKSI